ncbi:MAG TPA: prepilin-type N-terminal cleavage/methylation domain-containing protein [Candidatus Paceibacterota bacterium]|nr:prepilin-type N-terminal cleavage/methylation domain-containing protein [Candidatus Paceibacterota bacterium]
MNKKNKKNNNQRGFTLVETLIALSIFSTSVVAMMTLLGGGISDINYAKSKMTGTYLAQEGIEYMRNMRDTYMIDFDPADPQKGWQEFKSRVEKCTPAGNNRERACYFRSDGLFENGSIMDMALPACGNGQCIELKKRPGGAYGEDSSGSDSGFVRGISMINIGTDEIKVISTVSWQQKSGPMSVTFSENLYNWIE